jgi:hypothetical protein
MIPHSLRVNLLHVRRLLLTLSANRSGVLFWIISLILSSRCSFLINMFVFKILQIPNGCTELEVSQVHPLAAHCLGGLLAANALSSDINI